MLTNDTETNIGNSSTCDENISKIKNIFFEYIYIYIFKTCTNF